MYRFVVGPIEGLEKSTPAGATLSIPAGCVPTTGWHRQTNDMEKEAKS